MPQFSLTGFALALTYIFLSKLLEPPHFTWLPKDVQSNANSTSLIASDVWCHGSTNTAGINVVHFIVNSGNERASQILNWNIQYCSRRVGISFWPAGRKEFKQRKERQNKTAFPLFPRNQNKPTYIHYSGPTQLSNCCMSQIRFVLNEMQIYLIGKC